MKMGEKRIERGRYWGEKGRGEKGREGERQIETVKMNAKPWMSKNEMKASNQAAFFKILGNDVQEEEE